MPPRQRADQRLHELGLAESREAAKRLIMAGQAFLVTPHGPERLDKPGRQVALDADLSLAAPPRFVSRGGEKLLTALEAFGIDPAGRVCLDAGASTGGFTDCLLQHGAARVYAVDVGKAQLHEKLRADPRVVSLEEVNLRLAPPDLIPEPVSLIVADVSFISLTKVLPVCLGWLAPAGGEAGGEVLALIKPQFELGPGRAVKGVVRDEAARQEAVDGVVRFATETLGLTARGVVPSRILGPKGNQEYLAWFSRRARAAGFRP